MRIKKREVGVVGRIEEYAAATPPKNTIKANGAELDRVQFWRLFQYAQESGNLVDQAVKDRGQYGTGDGVNTFTIPDRRGVVGRGYDDGAGLDSSPTLGRYQPDDNKHHNHAMTNAGYHQHAYQNGGVGGGGYPSLSNGHGSDTLTHGSGDHIHGIYGTGAAEATMKNITLLYCIRYQ